MSKKHSVCKILLSFIDDIPEYTYEQIDHIQLELKRRLEQYGLSRKRIKSDGKCFFTCTGFLVNEHDPDLVRKNILDFLEKDTELQKIIEPSLGDADIKSYIQFMRGEYEWGTEREVITASKCYKRTFAVLTHDCIHIYGNGDHTMLDYSRINMVQFPCLCYDGQHYDVVTKEEGKLDEDIMEEEEGALIPHKGVNVAKKKKLEHGKFSSNIHVFRRTIETRKNFICSYRK